MHEHDSRRLLALSRYIYIYTYICVYIYIYQHVSNTKNHRIWEGPEELGEGPGDPLGGTMISKGGSL